VRLVYRMLRYGENYVEKGIEHYEEKFRLQLPIHTTGTMRLTAILTMGIRTTRTVIHLLPPPNGSRLPSPGAGIIAARLMAK
jgi:hypothetical protein